MMMMMMMMVMVKTATKSSSQQSTQTVGNAAAHVSVPAGKHAQAAAHRFLHGISGEHDSNYGDDDVMVGGQAGGNQQQTEIPKKNLSGL
jgi:hypothetical protein